jgi:DNA-binding NarL/FixJ family response regulator
MIRVALADDHALFRQGIRMILSFLEGIEVVFEAENGRILLEKLQSEPVDLVLLDLEMAELNGLEALAEIRRQTDGPRIIILSMHKERKLISHCMHSGANSYLLKDVSAEELEEAIRTVFEEGVYVNQHISKAIMSESRSQVRSFEFKPQLSPRELDLLQLICHELTNKEIADRLCLSERTVEGYRKTLIEKMDVKNSVGLVKKAILLNLVPVI